MMQELSGLTLFMILNYIYSQQAFSLSISEELMIICIPF